MLRNLRIHFSGLEAGLLNLALLFVYFPLTSFSTLSFFLLTFKIINNIRKEGMHAKLSVTGLAVTLLGDAGQNYSISELYAFLKGG